MRTIQPEAEPAGARGFAESESVACPLPILVEQETGVEPRDLLLGTGLKQCAARLTPQAAHKTVHLYSLRVVVRGPSTYRLASGGLPALAPAVSHEDFRWRRDDCRRGCI